MKDELVTRLFAHRDELLRLLEGLSEKQIASSLVHEKWTIKDMVGHISFRDQVTLDHIRESFTQGKPRPVREDEIEKQTSRRGRWNWKRVRAEFEHTRQALIERVQNLSEIEFNFIVPNPWYGEGGFYSIAQMIERDAIEPAEELTRWLGKTDTATW